MGAELSQIVLQWVVGVQDVVGVDALDALDAQAAGSNG